MKTIYRLFILLFLSAFYACTDETIPSVNHTEEGEPVTLSMNLSFPESENLNIETRAELSTKVSDFYLFIFNANGQLKDKYYFPQGATNSDAAYSSNGDAIISPTTDSSGKLTNIRTTSGQSYILGVANVAMKVGYEIVDNLNEVTTMQELKTALAVEPTVHPTTFTMSGYYSASEAVSTDGAVTIDKEVPLTGYIHLVPVDAHITFQVQAGTVTGRDFTFTLNSWQVVNVPQNVHLFHTGNEAATSYYNSILTTQLEKETPTTGKDIYSFDFFVQERLQEAAAEINSYGERAAWNTEGSQDADKKTFTNAPANATYVILKGRYKGKSVIQNVIPEGGTASSAGEAVQDVDAEVVYTIFLGEESATDFKDFTTNRNVNYTYVVTVNGVKDISVEVRADVENRPDAEGEIILSQGQVMNFDAHYAAVVLEFTKDEIALAKQEGRMGYSVISPYGNRIYVHGDEETTEQAAHADWVKFYKGTNQVNGTHYPATYNTTTIDGLLTVKGLLEELNEETFADDDVVRYTAYINEYYYDTNPTTGKAASWKEFVNVDDRKLMILADTEVSDDENSSITSAVYVLSQKSIKTIYNKEAQGLSRAWGLESVEEALAVDGRTTLTHGSATVYNYNQSAVYGRKNALYTQEQNTEIKWENMLAKTGYLSSDYNQNIYAACMLRNRDLDGDGSINADEIRWYVPTLYQYQQMYIGMYGIEDLDARLYYNEAVVDNKWEYKHYIASNSRQIMWAEEGLSNSTYKPGGSHTSSSNWSGTFTNNLRIRCVRDLGTKINKEDKVDNWKDVDHGFQDFYTKNGDVIELTYLNEASVRTNLENKEVTGDVTTFSASNRPAVKFGYKTTYLNNSSYDYYTVNTRIDNGRESDVCATAYGAGWRLPTLTELNLMTQVGQTFTQHTMCRTKFEFYDRQNGQGIPANSLVSNRYGRYWHMWEISQYNGNRFMLTNGNNGDAANELNAYIRCVKDGGN